MENRTADPAVCPVKTPYKDKRVLVLFLFGVLVVASDMVPGRTSMPRVEYGVQPGSPGQACQILRTGSDPQEMRPGFLLLNPAQPLPRELPAHYALLLHQPLPINRADRMSLELLPGVGPHLARLIIEDMHQHGPLATPEDLQRIRGIGPKTMQRLYPLVRCTE